MKYRISTEEHRKVVNFFFLNQGATVEEASAATGLTKELCQAVIDQEVPKFVYRDKSVEHKVKDGKHWLIPTEKFVRGAISGRWTHGSRGYDLPAICAKHGFPLQPRGCAARSVPAVGRISVTCPGCDKPLNGTMPSIMAAQTLRCSACGREFSALMLKGYLYVLSHPRMPGLVKIGRSEQWPDERVKQLNSPTGVPGPFTPEAYFASHAPEEHESEIKGRLRLKRIEGKEFFEAEVAKAVETVRAVVGTEPINPRNRCLNLAPDG